eukprot:CAMPEP_0203685370 /NCGR_PEP_ID=MMETSP0090-20130426/48514_1 /ASSEMBLY_ACC=CAM_ASM_001088 /TAXON_ID=426623 /ORGANISM="Chaetoceros affinis, Strain CCMP159" /LENGTH=331 /DNA_ID=CAMNT_0050554561 /DNA_START=181 /DNA_END=1172 /DNA_ORIENTATION=+
MVALVNIEISIVLFVALLQCSFLSTFAFQQQHQNAFLRTRTTTSDNKGECIVMAVGSMDDNEFNIVSKEKETLQVEVEGQGESRRRKLLHNSLSFFLASSATTLSPLVSNAESTAGYIPDMVGGLKKPKAVGGLTKKIRKVGDIMDELQRDLMQERWDLVEKYPEQLRSYVPVFTTYTDSAFPTESPTDWGLRVALRYEVGRFFASLERLKQASSRRALDEAYLAYSDASLHFDRYLHVGGLYTYYDATITNENFFKDVSPDSLVHSNPATDPALVRDLVVLIKGPDMGKTGIVIGMYSDGSNNCVVKLDRYMGFREIRVVPNLWAAKRLG